MSWSLQAGPAPVEEIAAAIDAVAEEKNTKAQQNDGTEEEVTAQIDAAKDAVQRIIDLGAVGNGHEVRVVLSGHANPGHEPREGYATDTVTVSVTQA